MLTDEKIQQIPLDDLVPSPGNRRIGGFDPDRLQQLADSIQAVGVQQPIVVRPNGQAKFEIVAGERRWKAARIAGLLDIPAVVRDIDDVTVLKIQTIENLQREDIHPLDEASGYVRLIEKAGYDVELIAREVGKSASYVYQRLKLQDLVPSAREMLIDDTITAGHAILIARLQPAQQKELAQWFKQQLQWNRGTPSVRELDDLIHRTILLELHKAAFKKDDSELLPAAGPCTTCPKRTGYQPALFADVCKKDYCTDPDCFNKKLDALVARRRQEIKGEKHMEVIDTYLSYTEEQRLPATIKKREQWSECKKKDEGAVRCLIVKGSDRGRLTWGVERKQTRYGYYEKSPQEKAAEKKRKREYKIKKTTRRQIWDAVMPRLHAKDGELPVFLLRIVTTKMFSRLWDNYRKLLCQLEGWERPPLKKGQNTWNRPGWGAVGAEKIQTMDESNLRLFMVKCALIDNMEVNEYQANDARELNQVAEFYDVDPKTLEAAIREEEKAKEAAKAARAKKAKKKKKS